MATLEKTTSRTRSKKRANTKTDDRALLEALDSRGSVKALFTIWNLKEPWSEEKKLVRANIDRFTEEFPEGTEAIARLIEDGIISCDGEAFILGVAATMLTCAAFTPLSQWAEIEAQER